jgi:DUF4097 and DUF4098 domain-containing protein YvlB
MMIRGIGFWVLALGLLPSLALGQSRVEERRAMAPDGTVSVSNVAGDISVTTWGRDEVLLTADLGRHQKLEVTETSQGVRFEVINIEGEDEYDEADLEVVCPAGASIEVEGVSSDIDIEGSRGASVTAESVSGDVTVAARVSRLELSSVSGDVEFEGAASRTSVESVSGDIDLQGLSGEVSISTVSGDAFLVAGSLSRGRFETVSGTLELELSAADGAKVTVQSMNGDVVLTLPEDQQAEFSAQSFSGDIDSAWGEVVHESFGPGSHLKQVTGTSGTVIRVESFSGDLRIGHK